MRISTYEIILPLTGRDDKKIRGKTLLINGLYGAMDVVDEGIADLLEKGDLSAVPFEVRERLASRGHITRRDEEGELADALLLGRIWNRLIGYVSVEPVILPTYDCNFRCPYCFERHRLTRGNEWLGRRMTKEMAEAVFAALQKQRDKGRKVEGIVLYGGEPLLKENRETVKNICEHAKAMGLDISCVTNGYDIDSFIDILEEYGFTELQITVDGVGEQNDRRRLHRDGVPTYDRIMHNIVLALKHGVEVRLRVNVNADNIGGIGTLIDDLKERGLARAPFEESGKAGFSYYFKAVSEDAGSPTKVTEQQVMDAILASGIPPLEAVEKQSQYMMFWQGLHSAMKKEGFPDFSTAYCGAEQGMICIGPDGMLYSCWDHVAMEERAVGFTDTEAGRFVFNFEKAKWRTRRSDLMESCRTCPYIFICRGGCALEAEKAHASCFSEFCGETKEIFAYVASRAAGKKWEEEKTDELSVSLSGPLSRLTQKERDILMTTHSQREMFDIIKDAGIFFTTGRYIDNGKHLVENIKDCENHTIRRQNMNISPLQKARYDYKPKLPGMLRGGISQICVRDGAPTESVADQDKIKALFPNTYGKNEITFEKGTNNSASKKQVVGVILSGGQAPGGHNVVCGLYDAIKATDKANVLLGFKGGPSGLIDDDFIEFDDEYIDKFRNTGGFDIIGSGRTKLETEEQFKIVTEVAKKHGLTAIVIIGGDDSNTNAAVLAEYMAANNTGVQVIGCPKTIDGDLKNEDIEASFGFDTATKTYSELIGNIERDANSAKKYWHFIKVMGRSASHVALECALETQANICLIGEEVADKKMSLSAIADYIADAVEKRGNNGENFGVAIIPEGIVEFVPEFSMLIAQINELLAGKKTEEFNALPDWDAKYDFIKKGLTAEAFAVFEILPQFVQQQLFLERDPHGNVQVSLIESEKLFSALVADKLAARKAAGSYKGKFAAQHHFFGYEGRCAFPSNFDADYCYSLGYNAFMLIQYGYTGYLSKVSNLSKPAEEWVAGGMPITKMMNMERRNGEDKPVIRKALVELDGKPFKYFVDHRDEWAVKTCFTYPGAIQYFGPAEVCDLTTRTLALEKG